MQEKGMHVRNRGHAQDRTPVSSFLEARRPAPAVGLDPFYRIPSAGEALAPWSKGRLVSFRKTDQKACRAMLSWNLGTCVAVLGAPRAVPAILFVALWESSAHLQASPAHPPD